jgi:hypothetical protein
MHEITNYPREGLTVQEFKIGDELELMSEWNNFYGSYYRCKTEKGYADINVNKSRKVNDATNTANR